MALTRVSPALFQVSNNITSVTVGGSANTISLTFDSNGVITGASNNAVSVANTAITGNIISSQITSVANTQISGNITAAQITSVANTQLTGLIQAAQIGSANATLITAGTLPKTRLPTGSVLQVVTSTNSTQYSTTSSTFSATGIAATITPISATSNILVMVHVSDCTNAYTNGSLLALKVYRASTAIISFGYYVGFNTAGVTITDVGTCSTSYLDSPATTSATTYTVYFASTNNVGTMYVNYNSGSTSTVTLMEIAA